MNFQKAAFALATMLALVTPLTTLADGDDRRFHDHAIVGRVASFWPYNLQMRNGQHIELHNGTVINPRGITLHGGMLVRIWGHPDRDGDFIADRIDVVPRHRNDDNSSGF